MVGGRKEETGRGGKSFDQVWHSTAGSGFFPRGGRVNSWLVPSSPDAPSPSSLYCKVGCEYDYEHNTHALIQGSSMSWSPEIVLCAVQRITRGVDLITATRHPHPRRSFPPPPSGSFQVLLKIRNCARWLSRDGREFHVGRCVSQFLFRHSVPCNHAMRNAFPSRDLPRRPPLLPAWKVHFIPRDKHPHRHPNPPSPHKRNSKTA